MIEFKVTGFKRFVFALATVFIWAGASWAGPIGSTISGNVADYNAAEARADNGVLVVPASIATYTAGFTLPIGSNFTVTLPAGFTFGSIPSLTTSGTSTFTLANVALGAQSAMFTVATSNVTPGQTISLASFSVLGATALGTVTPVANALPITMQAIGADASPLSFPAFASAPGATAIFVGAIQFIDETAPSDATEFLAKPDTLTAVISATAIQAQTVDATDNSVPILSPNGLLNTLSGADTATVTIPGNFRGIARAFASTTSDCMSPIAGSNGSISLGSVAIPKVPINSEEFFCLTGSGAILGSDPSGFPNATVSPGSSTDFQAVPETVEFPGEICYTKTGGGCDANFVPPPLVLPTPALSVWAMIGLAGMLLLFGAWKLKAIPATS